MFKLITLIVVLLSIGQPSVPPPEILATPIPYFSERASQDFENPVRLRAKGHRGIDLSGMRGDSVQAPFTGVVSFVGKVFHRSIITIRSETGLLASFEPICSQLVAGEEVISGQEIGRWCESDDDYREHCEDCVHFSIRSPRGYLNPMLFLGEVRPSVLIV
jgi:hypothetical protein